MRLRNIPGAREAVAEDPRCFDTGDDTKGRWSEIFGRTAPIYAEVGMGKGRFITDMAVKYPEINFIGIERYESVMIKALKKEVPGNVRFLRMDASDMEDFFNEGEIDRLYLNFSDPWPKDRHAKRRLTSRGFLKIFKKVLNKGGRIEFKTDNEGLFDYSLEEIGPTGFKLIYSSRDLHNDPEAMKDNVMTEYEEKFSAKGNKIFKYMIIKES